MRGIDDADDEGTAKPPTETEPEGGKDYRDIEEALEYVMQIVEVQRGQVVKQGDADD